MEAEFQIKKQLFDKIVDHVKCNFCQIIPVRAPILHSNDGGLVSCWGCQEKFESKGFHRNYGLEDTLRGLHVPCKFKSNNCQETQDPHNIIKHEELCDVRNVNCFHTFCKKVCPLDKLLFHYKNKHKRDLQQVSSEHSIKKIGTNSYMVYFGFPDLRYYSLLLII